MHWEDYSWNIPYILPRSSLSFLSLPIQLRSSSKRFCQNKPVIGTSSAKATPSENGSKTPAGEEDVEADNEQEDPATINKGILFRILRDKKSAVGNALNSKLGGDESDPFWEISFNSLGQESKFLLSLTWLAGELPVSLRSHLDVHRHKPLSNPPSGRTQDWGFPNTQAI